jgi:SnoaL-like domain
VGAVQDRNVEAVTAFYASGPAATDEERRSFFASDFIWHVPGDNPVSGPYGPGDYFDVMPARMLPLDDFSIEPESFAANADLVITVCRLSGHRFGRTIDAVGGHVFRFDAASKIAEAWGWCADQSALDAFFAAAD